jgi:eukaryotic-like serine/threonine-protein kinase
MHPTFQPGELLAGRYRIREMLGGGTVGTVYRAQDMGLNTDVALKIVGPDMLPDVPSRRTFIQGVRRAQAVDHPCLARILDVRQDGEHALVSTQLLEGLTLRRLLTSRKEKRHRMPPAEVRPILEQVAEALTTAHPEICHGCLKPEDIILLPDHVKVLDLGMAAALPRETFLVAYRQASAPLAYLAPELRARMPVTPRADVYSLGVVVYEMLTGVAPLEAPRSVRSFDDGLVPAYDEIVRRALSVDPAHRYRAPEGLVADFVAVLEGRALGPPPYGSPALSQTGSVIATPVPSQSSGDGRAPVTPAAEAQMRAGDGGAEPADGGEIWPFVERTPPPGPPPAAPVVAEPPETPALAEPIHAASQEAAPDAPWIESESLREATPTPAPMPAAFSRPTSVPASPGEPAERASPAPTGTASPGPAAAAPAPPPAQPFPPDDVATANEPVSLPAEPAPPPAGPRASGALPRATGAPLPPADLPRPAPPALRPATIVAGVVGCLLLGLLAAGLVRRFQQTRLAQRADEEERRTYERELRSRMSQATPAPHDAQPAAPPTPQAAAEPPPSSPPAVPAEPAQGAATEHPRPAHESSRPSCPEGMKLIESKRAPYCIDKYEFPGGGLIPRVNVSWDEADAACHARDARLCEAGEWERACRGPNGADYPYGEPWDPLACNSAGADGAPRGVLNSGAQRECRSAHGVYDMSGNVAEWVEDRSVRGGSARSGEAESRCGSSSPGGASAFVGFRCCRSAEGSE